MKGRPPHKALPTLLQAMSRFNDRAPGAQTKAASNTNKSTPDYDGKGNAAHRQEHVRAYRDKSRPLGREGRGRRPKHARGQRWTDSDRTPERPIKGQSHECRCHENGPRSKRGWPSAQAVARKHVSSPCGHTGTSAGPAGPGLHVCVGGTALLLRGCATRPS